MLSYVIRRIAYGVLVVLGVLFLLFVLFFTVTSPEDVARKALGEKAMPAVIERWKALHGYDRPKWPTLSRPRDNMLFEHYRRMLTFDFGRSDADDVLISKRLAEGVGPSLALSLPMFVLELFIAIAIALLIAFLRETYVDKVAAFLCVLGMSISILLYIIAGQ